jgi:hypothetical protein
LQEIDIWRTAHVLMKQHGERAAFVAAERADALFAKDDFMGAAVFTRVARAIQDLERLTPREGEATN